MENILIYENDKSRSGVRIQELESRSQKTARPSRLIPTCPAVVQHYEEGRDSRTQPLGLTPGSDPKTPERLKDDE
jgi:hypothetical protein